MAFDLTPLPDPEAAWDAAQADSGGRVEGATVFAPDGRVAVANSTLPGWRTITLLLLYDQSAHLVATCSGVMVGYNVVLTAAHCLYGSGQFVGSVVVAPGATPQSPPFGVATAKNFVVPQGWINTVGQLDPSLLQPPSPWDYGLVFLQGSPFGNAIAPYLTVASVPDSYFGPQVKIATAGFPGDKPVASMWWTSSSDYFVDDIYLYTDMDMAEGQSGSAILSLDASGNGYIFSVVSGGNALFNRSVRFTGSTMDSLRQACSIYSCTIQATDFTHYEPRVYFCRSSPTCAGGTEALVAGEIVRVGFELNPNPIAKVRAEFFWNGLKVWAADWEPPTAPGGGRFYLKDPALGYPISGGKLEMKLWVGDLYVGVFSASVPPPPLTARRYRTLAPSVSSDGLR